MGTPVFKPDTKGLETHESQIPENLAELQRGDETLKALFGKAEGLKESNMEEQYVINDGILYAQTADVLRVVVPLSCRPLVLYLAHTIPWAGHLAPQKTYMRISSRFYWPTMYTDVHTYCTTCTTCQKTSAVR